MRSERTHVLLDLDGTLSDSEPGILRSLQWAFEKEGFPIPTEEQVRSVIGPPFEIGLPQIGIPDDDLERVIDRYRERYATIGAFENTLYPGIVEMLDALSSDGLSLSVATAKPEVTAHPILDYFDISENRATENTNMPAYQEVDLRVEAVRGENEGIDIAAFDAPESNYVRIQLDDAQEPWATRRPSPIRGWTPASVPRKARADCSRKVEGHDAPRSERLSLPSEAQDPFS